ncbi:Glycerol dehydratase large subunit [Koleobacter methoxysyntrophicus]|uniref:Glycerol dehydratase large subunit n=1 Tax=Koleobacter methoxysyntrophicus TaxID=2751313 RepID=A0A8A0RL75_9FIRM|nr:propanediol/glycerol family dehydratase large subunit [Koleobacter methoxysyntrophicus]QSQ08227.1 Glycerol dehydratase large subunit [Koleobacter methoxysyntrophicus]
MGARESDNRKQEFLDAALDLFYQKGYENTTINDIIDKVGLSKGAFYHYFNSKEEVLETIARQYVEKKLNIVEKVDQVKNLNALEKFNKIIRDMLDFKVQYSELRWKIYKIIARNNNIKLESQILDNYMELALPIYKKIIKQGVEEGIFNTSYPEEVAELYIYLQGLQNGSISCIGVPGAVPSGIRAVLAENLITTMLDLEVASGNDQTFSHSDVRRTARTMMQFLPGTDFIFSGYSAVPNYDNMFAGSNFDAEDFDDYNILQRDLQVDGGVRPVSEEEVIAVRNKAARAIQAVFKGLGLPPIAVEEVEAATYAHGSKDMPDRDVPQDLKAAEEMINRGVTGIDVVKALAGAGFEDVAEKILNLLKQRVSGDYLHTSAILDKDFNVISAVNNKNDYQGPGTGYRISKERWEEIKNIRNAIMPEDFD